MSVLADTQSKADRAPERSVRTSSVIWTVVAIVAATPLLVLAALGTQILVGLLLPPAALDSFRVGQLAQSGKTKTGDALFPFVFFGLLLLVAGLTRRFLGNREPPRPLKQFLALEAVCAVPIIVQSFLGTGRPLLPVVDSPVLATALVQLAPACFFLVWTWLVRRRRTSAQARRQFLPFLLLSSTMALAALGTVTALRHTLAPTPIPPALVITVAAIVAVGLSASVALLLAWEGADRKVTLSVGFTGAALLTLPLLLPPLMAQDGRAVPVPGPDILSWKIALTLLGILLVVEALIRHIWRENHGFWFAIPSVAIAIFAGPLRATYGLPGINADDYHFGEMISPFTLWLNSGQIPYTDQLLPRGILLNVVPDAVNTVLNDGSAAALGLVFVFIAVVIAAIAHLLLRRSIGFGLATVAVLLMAIANTTMEGDFLVGAMLLWTLAFALRRPNAIGLGVVCVVVNTVAILAYPMMGIVSAGLTVGAVGLGFVGAALSKSRAEIGYAVLATVAGVATAIAVGLSPIGPVVLAAIRYVVSNAAGNSEAFGIALEATWETPFAAGQVISMGFVLGFFASIYLLWQKRRNFRTPQLSGYLSLGVAAVPAVLVLVLLGRYFGRIDSGEWPIRLAAGSLLVLGLIVPGVVHLVAREKSRTLTRVSIAIAACLSIVILPLGQGGGVRSSLGMLDAPSEWTSAEATTTIPTLGLGMDTTAHTAELTELRSISSDLPPGEKVLNLSNRGALFAYLGWNNPIAYLAPYNIETAAAEIDVVAALEKDPPTYAFVGPGPQHDGGSLTLRTPMLAHWVADNYTPIHCGGFTWATLGTGDTGIGAGDLICPDTAETDAVTSIPALWTASIGAPADLGLIPASWGARAGQITAVDATVTETASPNATQNQSFQVDLEPRGNPTDLLVLSAVCAANPQAAAPSSSSGNSRATLTWADTGAADGRSASFVWGAGKFIVPVDAYPEWSQADPPPESLQLVVPGIDCPGPWRVRASSMQRTAE